MTPSTSIMRSGTEGLIAWKLDVSLMALKAGAMSPIRKAARRGHGSTSSRPVVQTPHTRGPHHRPTLKSHARTLASCSRSSALSATQLGFLYKHRGANAAPQVDVRHPLRTGARCSRPSGSRSAWPSPRRLGLPRRRARLRAAVGRPGGALHRRRHARRDGRAAVRLQGRRCASGSASASPPPASCLLVVTLPASTGAHSTFSLAGMIAFEAACS